MSVTTGSAKILNATRNLAAETVKQSALTTLDVAARSTEILTSGASTVSGGIVRASYDAGRSTIRELVNYTPDIYDVGQKGRSDLSVDGAMFIAGNTAMVARAGARMVAPAVGKAVGAVESVLYNEERMSSIPRDKGTTLSYHHIATGYSRNAGTSISKVKPIRYQPNAFHSAGVKEKATAIWGKYQSGKYDRMMGRKKGLSNLSSGLSKNGFSISHSISGILSNQSRKMLNSLTRGNDPSSFANKTLFIGQKSLYTLIRNRTRLRKLFSMRPVRNVVGIVSGIIRGIISFITSIPVVVSTCAMVTPFVVIVAVIATIVTSILGAWHIDYTTHYNFQYMNLSPEVLQWSDEIERWCQSNWDVQYVPLVLAVIQVESSGMACDLMQSSESHGGGPPGSGCGVYTSQLESLIGSNRITGGIAALKYCCDVAGVSSATDMENIKLALQGFNYGVGYIHWAVSNYGGYSQSNAQTYACLYGGPSCSYGFSGYVQRVLQYYYVGGTGTICGVPDWNNMNAWGSGNIYFSSWPGQCTYYALGMVIQTYGQPTGGYTNYWFCGNGCDNVGELITYHPEKWKYSPVPGVGGICSTFGQNHVMFVIGWDGVTMTVFEGNMDGYNNYDWPSIKADCRIYQYTLEQLQLYYGNHAFAVPIGG